MGSLVALVIAGSALLAQDEAYDGRSTEDTVRFVVGGLLVIAAAMALLTVAYMWHTSPRRRRRVADARAARSD